MSTFNINNINSDTGINIPDEIIVQCIKDMSEAELKYMHQLYVRLDQFFGQSEEQINLLFTEEEQNSVDSYSSEIGEHAIFAYLVKNILEKL